MTNKLLLAIAASLASASVYAYDGTFATVDTNADGNVTTDEFYGSAADWGVYSDYDLDNDGLYTESEWNEFGWDYDYNTWDANADGFLDSGEYYDGIYTTYDVNEDGHWDNGEWDDAGDAGLWDI